MDDEASFDLQELELAHGESVHGESVLGLSRERMLIALEIIARIAANAAQF